MIVSAIKCPKCKDTVYSRVRHDLRSCSCGYCWIDGGHINTKAGYGIENPDESFEFTHIDTTSNLGELFKDWNEGIDKLGIIKEKDDV
jgi:hypothetical protein